MSRNTRWMAVALAGLLPGEFALAAESEPAAEASGEASPGEDGSATVPLATLLTLRDRALATEPEAAVQPPVDAAVARAQLEGRLLDDAVELELRLEVTVLADGRWVQVPLVRVEPGTSILNLPAVQDGALVIRDGRLCLVTRHAGTRTLQISMLAHAKASGVRRTVDIEVEEPAQAVLHLRFDTDLFRLLDADSANDSDGAKLYGDAGRFLVRWARIADAAPRRATPAVTAPAEPVITAAHASVVCTLEGKRITRVLYELRFDGAPSITLTVPEGQRVERLYLDGAARPIALTGRELTVALRHARAGDELSRLELVLASEQSGYMLSGQLEIALPAASWRINQAYATLHLPQVFNYAWSGGSLAWADSVPEVEYAYRIPTPGKRLMARQQLVFFAPTVKVNYTVDLAGAYFR